MSHTNGNPYWSLHPVELIRTWHAITIIRTRKWLNNTRPWYHHCWLLKCIVYWVWITSVLRTFSAYRHQGMWDSKGGTQAGFKRCPPWIIKVAPTDSRGGSRRVCLWRDTLFCVALSCMWHFVSFVCNGTITVFLMSQVNRVSQKFGNLNRYTM